MLVAKFNCPACEAVLEPAAPVPSGKKVKCPKCARVIVVPTPEDDFEEAKVEVETVEEVEPARKQPRKAREEDEEEQPSRRRAAREDEDDGEERPQKPRKKAQKKARSGGTGLKIALFAGIGVLVLAGLGVGGYFLVARIGGDPRVRALDDATSVLAGVKDQASAQVARPALVAVGQRLRELHEKDIAAMNKALDELRKDPDAIQRAIDRDPGAIQRAIDEAMKNPEKARAEAERQEREREAKLLPMKTAMQNMSREASRVAKVPGGKELLDAFWDAWGEEGKLISWAIGMTPTREEPSTPKKGDINSVRLGMTEQQVTDIMGKPFNIDTNRPGLRVLSYITGAIDIKDGKVVKKFP